MKLAAIAKLIKADGYCKLYKVFYDDCRTYDLYIGTSSHPQYRIPILPVTQSISPSAVSSKSIPSM